MRIFLIAGETSGDALGAALMRALRQARPDVEILGVGGAAMATEGLESLFPIEDIAVMGLLPVLARLPTLAERIRRTARAVIAAGPACLVLIDAPDFTHRVARKVRRAAPRLPVVDYVSPTVWAWRSGRARAMRAYVDCVLALLPFEPAAYRRLRGPPCIYVGHPLVEHIDALAPRRRELTTVGAPASNADADPRPQGERLTLLVLPGSRRAEIARMTPLYGETVARLLAQWPDLDVAIPVAPGMESLLREKLRNWTITPRLLTPHEKYPAYRDARAALVTSGTATLELALAGVPMAAAYKVSPLEYPLRRLIEVAHFALPNLVLGERAVPEFLQHEATPAALARALAPLLGDSETRRTQVAALANVRDTILRAGRDPSARAAEIVLERAVWG